MRPPWPSRTSTRAAAAPPAPLPLPPPEMRRLVGPVDPAEFDNPTGAPVFDGLPDDRFASVLDFGCGCGRIARRMIQQTPRPSATRGSTCIRG